MSRYIWQCDKCGFSCYGDQDRPKYRGSNICEKGGSHSWQRCKPVGQNGGGCFITTAVCQTLGAPDDCKELTMIRNFRDGRLRRFMEDGELLVNEYYRIGPMIVNAIEKDADATNIYTQLWNNRIKPCCEQIEQQNWEQVKLIYIKMVKELCEKYNIIVDPILSKKYFS